MRRSGTKSKANSNSDNSNNTMKQAARQTLRQARSTRLPQQAARVQRPVASTSAHPARHFSSAAPLRQQQQQQQQPKDEHEQHTEGKEDPKDKKKQEQQKQEEDTTVEGRSPFAAFVDVLREEVRKNREWQDSVKQLGGEVSKVQDSEAMRRAKEVYERARVRFPSFSLPLHRTRLMTVLRSSLRVSGRTRSLRPRLRSCARPVSD